MSTTMEPTTDRMKYIDSLQSLTSSCQTSTIHAGHLDSLMEHWRMRTPSPREQLSATERLPYVSGQSPSTAQYCAKKNHAIHMNITRYSDAKGLRVGFVLSQVHYRNRVGSQISYYFRGATNYAILKRQTWRKT